MWHAQPVPQRCKRYSKQVSRTTAQKSKPNSSHQVVLAVTSGAKSKKRAGAENVELDAAPKAKKAKNLKTTVTGKFNS
jgi:hypothetical protein